MELLRCVARGVAHVLWTVLSCTRVEETHVDRNVPVLQSVQEAAPTETATPEPTGPSQTASGEPEVAHPTDIPSEEDVTVVPASSSAALLSDTEKGQNNVGQTSSPTDSIADMINAVQGTASILEPSTAANDASSVTAKETTPELEAACSNFTSEVDNTVFPASSSAALLVGTEKDQNNGESANRSTCVLADMINAVQEMAGILEPSTASNGTSATAKLTAPIQEGLARQVLEVLQRENARPQCRGTSLDECPYKGPTVQKLCAGETLIYPPVNLGERLQKYFISLETCIHQPSTSEVVHGYVNVLKKGRRRHRKVTVKYSTDRWKSSQTVKCTFSRTDPSDGQVARYGFKLPFSADAEIDFFAVYRVKGTKYYDNNCGADYTMCRV